MDCVMGLEEAEALEELELEEPGGRARPSSPPSRTPRSTQWGLAARGHARALVARRKEPPSRTPTPTPLLGFQRIDVRRMREIERIR